MASNQRSLITSSKSKLCHTDIKSVLGKEAAWSSLPFKTREHLYSLLPQPQAGEPAHDLDVHPLKSVYKTYIEEELRRWQEDLTDGRETKKWREEAMLAGRERREGAFDEWKEKEREEYWGVSRNDSKAGGQENVEPQDDEADQEEGENGEVEAKVKESLVIKNSQSDDDLAH